MRDNQLDEAAAFLARDPSASLARVAEAIGVGRATVARHYPKREDLLRALAMRSLQVVDEAVAGLESEVQSGVEYVERSFERLVPIGANFHFLQSEIAVLADDEFRAELDRQLEEVGVLVRQLKQEGAIDRAVPDAWAVAVMDSLLYAAWQSVEAGDIAPNDAARLATRTFFSGLQDLED